MHTAFLPSSCFLPCSKVVIIIFQRRVTCSMWVTSPLRALQHAERVGDWGAGAEVAPGPGAPEAAPAAAAETVPLAPVTRALAPSSPLRELLYATYEEPPSLLSVCPWLHKYTQFVLGPWGAAAPLGPPSLKKRVWRELWLTRHALFWSLLSLAGFITFCPLIGPCGGGWTANCLIGTMFAIPFVGFFILRFALYTTLHALHPIILHFEPRDELQSTINTKKRFLRDKNCLTRLTACLATLFPAVVVILAFYAYVIAGLNQLPWNTGNGPCDSRLDFGVFLTFFPFFGAVFIAALQVLLIALLSRLNVFRFKVLYAALVRNDQALLLRELSPNTLKSNRLLLASAPKLLPHAAPGAGYVSASPTPRDAVSEHLDNFLLVYRAIQEECERQAKLWSAPIVLFIAIYAFVFASTVWSLLQSVARGTAQGAIRLEFLYCFLALVFLLLNLMPVIAINSKWPALLARLDHTWEHWSPAERTVLTAYFERHPLVFPVMGLTFTWGKVAGLVATAVVPLLVNAATNALAAPDPGPAGGNATGSV